MQLADLKPKPWGKCLESLSISKTAQHLLDALIFFRLYWIGRGGESFPKGCFWLNAATFMLQNVNCLSSLTDDSVLEKCPFVEKADIF